MPLFVAIDAGGSKTRCWVADETRVLGRAETGTVKVMNIGEDAASERLAQVVREAARGARADLTQVQRTCMGLAGVSSESTRAWAEANLRSLVAGEILIRGDEAIALDAAFGNGPGVLVIAGTGSHVVGRAADGSLASAGGWGPLLGDEGSGTWIGLEAIRAALRAHDRGVNGMLLREIEAFWGMSDLGELVAKANRRPRPDFAELAGSVAACAVRGDELAGDVLRRAGEELALQVQLALARITPGRVAGRMTGRVVGDDAPDVAFTGSVLAKIPAVFNAFAAALAHSLPQARLQREPVEPLQGALWRARQS